MANHDLLMRSHSRDESGSVTRDFGAVDMELLRKCPCAVMLVRHGRSRSIQESPQQSMPVLSTRLSNR